MIKPRKTIENLAPYQTDLYKTDWRLKLDSNENIYGCSSNVMSAIRNFDFEDVSLYPTYGKLIDKVSSKYEINKNSILFSNGCDEALSIITNTYLDYNDEILSFTPSFSMPALYSKIIGANVKFIDYKEKFCFDKELVKENITPQTKIFYIATPNNPTGEVVKASMLSGLIKEFNNVLFVIDCTYVNFSSTVAFEDYLELTKEFDNVIVTKSFSKDFALAGLRFGLTIANEEIINNLKKVASPYNVNIIAINCAYSSLNDDKNFYKIKELNEKAREYLYNGLIELGFKAYPSEANFILCDFGNYSNYYYEKLRKNGVIVRKYSKNSPINSCLRITVPKMGGVKFIIELLKKRKMLAFNLENIIFDFSKNEQTLLLNKENIEELIQDYDLVLISKKQKQETETLLEQYNINKFFYYISSLDDEENDINNILKHCPNLTLKYLPNNIEDAIIGNSKNIEMIGIIPQDSDYNQMVNSYKHIGIQAITNDIANIVNYIKENEKQDE